MVVYLGLGVVVLVLGLFLLRRFLEADPALLARELGRFALVLVAILSLAVIVLGLASERAAIVLAGIAGLDLVWVAARRRRVRLDSPPSLLPAAPAEIETEYVVMRLDRESGNISGTVRKGRLRGRGLGDLSRDQLVSLWRQCRPRDRKGASLLEVYLDRFMPSWRAAAGTVEGPRDPAADGMSRDEALAVLGLNPDAPEAEIREAYHRLMLKIDPELGGSAYLGAKIKQARDILLGR